MSANMARQYSRLLALWPKDALRPSLPFTSAIQHRARPYGVAPINPEGPEGAPPAAAPPNPRLDQMQVNALYSLLENRYSSKYALSPAVFKPTSAPHHYERLLAEIERAPRKTWWQAKLDQWKMKVRWS